MNNDRIAKELLTAESLIAGYAYSEALAGESVTDVLKRKWDPVAEAFYGVTDEDLEEYARIVAYKVVHNIGNGFKMDGSEDPLTYVNGAEMAKELLAAAQEVLAEAEKVKDGIAKGQLVEINPTPEQIDSANYKKGHVVIGGLDISIENPLNSTRSGVSPDGKEWSQTMRDDYGYVKGSKGYDKDHVDVFINPDLSKGHDEYDVYVVNQMDGKKFDEHKCMIGYPSEAKAKQAYLRNYEKGWDGCGSIITMSWEDFKNWIMGAGPAKGELSNNGMKKESMVMDKEKVAKELVSVAKELAGRSVKAESKGTIDAYSNRDGGSLTLRKLFGTMPAERISPEANRIAKIFLADVKDVIAERGITADLTIGEPNVSGFSQGGYFEVWLSIRELGFEVWELLDDLKRKGYKLKR